MRKNDQSTSFQLFSCEYSSENMLASNPRVLVDTLFEIGPVSEVGSSPEVYIVNKAKLNAATTQSNPSYVCFYHGLDKVYVFDLEVADCGSNTEEFDRVLSDIPLEAENLIVLDTSDSSLVISVFGATEKTIGFCDERGCFYIVEKKHFMKKWSHPSTSTNVDDLSSVMFDVRAPKNSNVSSVTSTKNGFIVARGEEKHWEIDVYTYNKETSEKLSLFCSYKLHRRKMFQQSRVSFKPIVKCIQPNGDMSSEDKFLYKSLFGEEALLLKSQVLLVALPDGQVYTIVLKSWSSRYTENQGNQNSKLICCLNQSIVGLFFCLDDGNLETEINENNNFKSIVVVGSCGKLLLIGYSSMSSTVGVQELQISGPVLTCTVHSKQLIYSDGSQILRALILETKLEVVPVCDIPNVISFLVVYIQRKEDAEVWTALLLSSTGRMMKARLKIDAEAKNCQTMDRAKQVKVNDILAKMESDSKALEHINDQLLHQGSLIHSLAVASSLLHNNEVRTQNFKTLCTVHKYIQDWTRLTLELSVTNCSPFTLSKSIWCFSFLITYPSEDEYLGQVGMVKSTPLSFDLKPGDCFKTLMTVPVHMSLEQWQLPLKVWPTLQLLVPDRYVADIQSRSHRKENSSKYGSLSVSLFPLVSLELPLMIIDELHILEPNDCKCIGLTTTSLQQMIWNMAKQKIEESNLFPLSSLGITSSPTILRIPIGKDIALGLSAQSADENEQIGHRLMTFIFSYCGLSKSLKDLMIKSHEANLARCGVRFDIQDQETVAVIEIKSNNFMLSLHLRRAILRRIQHLGASKTSHSGRLHLSPSNFKEIQRLAIRLNRPPSSSPVQDFYFLNIYKDLRERVTSHLPLF